MKFSIPFFGKRTADTGTDAPEQESTSPSAADQPAKKPFVVPESAASMPSFSQPAELADIAAPMPAIENTAADEHEPNPTVVEVDATAAVVVDTGVVDKAVVDATVVDATVVEVAVPQEEEPQAEVVEAEPPSAKVDASPAPNPAAVVASPAPAAEAAAPSEVPTQMNSMAMSQEDIIAAYKIFLKRHPENLEVVQPRVGLSGDRILLDFLSSGEFTSRPEVVQLIFALAKKLLEEQKAKSATESSNAGEAETANAVTENAEKKVSS
jgi:hypothetical protein